MAEFLLQWILKYGNRRSDDDDDDDDDDDEESIQEPIQKPMDEAMDDPIDGPKDDPSKSGQSFLTVRPTVHSTRPKTSAHPRAQRAVLHHVQVSQMGYTCSLLQLLPRISTLEASLTST